MFCYLDVIVLVMVKFKLFTTDKFLCITLRRCVLSYKILINTAGSLRSYKHIQDVNSYSCTQCFILRYLHVIVYNSIFITRNVLYRTIVNTL